MLDVQINLLLSLRLRKSATFTYKSTREILTDKMVSVTFPKPFIGQLTEEVEIRQSRFDKIIDARNRTQEINLYTQHACQSAFARTSRMSNVDYAN